MRVGVSAPITPAWGYGMLGALPVLGLRALWAASATKHT